MSVAEVIERRGIGEIMHFTTNVGLIGILQTQQLTSRQRLPEDKYLEYIYRPNCEIRRDKAWLDYVNLSIDWINPSLFRISSGRWHRGRDIWWCVLGFDPIILTHAGVQFVTTNNMYSGARRAASAAGLEALFGPTVVQYVEYVSGRATPSQVAKRGARLPDNYPTCDQAEVLYPRSVSTDYLRHINVENEDHGDRAHAILAAVPAPGVEIVERPELFQNPRPNG
jgi:hypothetical protein